MFPRYHLWIVKSSEGSNLRPHNSVLSVVKGLNSFLDVRQKRRHVRKIENVVRSLSKVIQAVKRRLSYEKCQPKELERKSIQMNILVADDLAFKGRENKCRRFE